MDFAVFRVFLGISRDFAEIPQFRGFATTRNIRSPVLCTDVQREIKDNHYAKCQGINQVRYGLGENGQFDKCFLNLIKTYMYYYYYYYYYLI